MNLMRPFFLLILFLFAALPAARAEPQFTIEPVGGKVTAAWKGTADTKRQRVFLITGFFCVATKAATGDSATSKL